MTKKKKEVWQNSKVKQILRDAIISGEVTEAMPPRVVYQMDPEFQKWPKENFGDNYRRLQKAVATDFERSHSDTVAYGLNRQILLALRAGTTRTQATPWHKSPARALLKQDMAEGKHLQMKPKDLYSTREEYKDFDLKVFRKHIYQRADMEAKRESRFAKKKTRPTNRGNVE